MGANSGGIGGGRGRDGGGAGGIDGGSGGGDSVRGAFLVVLGAMASYQPFFFAGVARTGVAVGSVVTVGSSPILAGGLAYLFLGEVPGRRWYVSTVLAVAGCVLLMLPRSDFSTVDPAGVLLALMAGLSYSSYVLTGKRLSQTCTVDALNAVVFSGAGLLLLPVFLLQPPVWLLDIRGALAALHLGLLATALAYVLFVRGLIRVPASTGVTLSLAEPLTATVLGLVLLGERLEPIGFIGLGLLLLSVVLLSIRPDRRGRPAERIARAGGRLRRHILT